MNHPANTRTWSRRLAGLLVGAGLILLALSLLMLYVGRILLRADTFADRVSDSLHDPRVGEFVALRITDAVIAQQPDLTALRPILVVVTRGVVTSAPFRALLRPALRKTHQALLSSTAENILLAVPDAGVLINEALKAVGPAAAARVPRRLQPVLQLEAAAPAFRTAGRALGKADVLRPFGRVGLVVGVILIITAIVVSPARRSTMLSAGVGVATVGVVLALMVPAGRLLAVAAIPDASAAGAATGLWLAFFGPLRIAGIVVAIIGVALALVAVPGGTIDPRALRDRAWALASERRGRPLAEAGRLAAVGIAGLVALISPAFALATAAVGAGAALLMLCLVGVRRLVHPALPAAITGTGETVRVAPAVLAGVRVIVLLVVGVSAAAALLRIRVAEVVVASGGACNGAVVLCARPLNQVTFPGAHNAMGSAKNPAWLFPNQDLDIRGLLDRGVRAFLLDPYRGNRMAERVRTDFDAVLHANRKIAEVIGPEAWAAGMRMRAQLTGEPGASGMYLCHGFCEFGAVPFAPALRTFVEFLVTHPGEVIIIDFEDYAPPEDIEAAFTESGLIDFVYRGPLEPTWPTLGEMVASGGRVLVLGETDVGTVPWYHLAWAGMMAETPYTFRRVEDFSCRANRGAPRGDLFLVNHWIETTPTPRPSNAEIVNQRDVIVRRVRQCERERRMKANILAVDFAGIGDVVGAARELNGVPEPAATP